MALTRDELIARRAWIGSSDIPAILGAVYDSNGDEHEIDEYQSAGDVYLAKIGALEVDETTSEAAEIGNRMEPMMVRWARDRLAAELGHDLTLEFNRRFVHENGIFSAQCDGWLPELGEVIESKAHGMKNPNFDPSEWGASGTDEIPFRTMAQVNFQMLVTGAPRAHVAVFLGRGVGPRFYVVERRPDLMDLIHRKAERFWREHVKKRVPPPEPPRLPALRRAVKEPGKSVAVDAGLPFEFEAARDAVRDAKAKLEDVQRRILATDPEAEEYRTPVGSWTHRANKNGTRVLRYKSAEGK